MHVFKNEAKRRGAASPGKLWHALHEIEGLSRVWGDQQQFSIWHDAFGPSGVRDGHGPCGIGLAKAMASRSSRHEANTR
jgi:hypothetical protein